jgi:hypothetical protein
MRLPDKSSGVPGSGTSVKGKQRKKASHAASMRYSRLRLHSVIAYRTRKRPCANTGEMRTTAQYNRKFASPENAGQLRDTTPACRAQVREALAAPQHRSPQSEEQPLPRVRVLRFPVWCAGHATS